MEQTTSDYDREKLQERLAKLSGEPEGGGQTGGKEGRASSRIGTITGRLKAAGTTACVQYLVVTSTLGAPELPTSCVP